MAREAQSLKSFFAHPIVQFVERVTDGSQLIDRAFNGSPLMNVRAEPISNVTGEGHRALFRSQPGDKVMMHSKLALLAAGIAVAFASPAFAKTVRQSQNGAPARQQQLYDSTQPDNPYYAPYSNQTYSSGGFVVGGFR
jgi:hypothetical protein